MKKIVSLFYNLLSNAILRILLTLIISLVVVIGFAPKAWAFCGFYVAKADSKLYNQASQVVIARDGDRTILTMANDYQGDIKDFAMVVPVPVVLTQEQVRVGDSKIIKRLDDFSAPRLVEYFDPDPCQESELSESDIALPASGDILFESRSNGNAGNLGVTVEARFQVEEYDVLILSAKESRGLETWLKQNGYKIPQGANRLFRPYIRQGMKFFVAKVNLDEFPKTDSQFLRPLMIAYESPKFILPIRLGMINATTEQDMIVYILSPKGQAEITNYRTVKVPSNVELPVFVKDEFADFYKTMFQTAYEQEKKKVAFLEYAWDMGWCDPCSAEPLSREELAKAGVFWLTQNVFLSRLHVRYTRDKFPEDLIFQETSNRQNFQGRYILRHPFTGNMSCSAGKEYQKLLHERLERETQTLAKLTNWKIQDIRKKVNFSSSEGNSFFWRNIWR